MKKIKLLIYILFTLIFLINVNASFLNYKNITIKGANSLLIDIPIYIHLNDTTNMNIDGSDIRFFDSNNISLSYEIESFTINDANIWVKIPYINTSNKIIKLYYNNNNASDGQNISNVWSNGFVAVHHLTNMTDSVNSHDLYNIGDPISTTNAIIGKAYDLSLDDGFYIEDHDNFSFISGELNDTTMTLSMWLNFDNLGIYNILMGKMEMATNDREYLFFIYNNKVRMMLQDNSYDTDSIGRESNNVTISGNWTYLTSTYTGSKTFDGIKIYKDGLIIDINNLPDGTYNGMSNTSTKPSIGAGWNGYPNIWGGIDAKIDEVRWQSTVRTQNWINYTYQNIMNQEIFITIGEEQTIIYNSPPIFNYSIPNFVQYINTAINYTNYYYDVNNDNITINTSCNIINVTILDNYRFNIYYYANIINKTYCNLTICDYQNCTISNDFYIEILPPGEISYNYAFLDLRERDNITLLSLLVFIYVIFICFGIFSKNLIIKSFGILLGITIAIILFQIHWILFLIFILKNVSIWIYT